MGQNIENFENFSKANKIFLVTFLSFVTFILISLLSINDLDLLFYEKSTLTLPIINSEVNIYYFGYLSILFITIFYIYLLANLYNHIKAIKKEKNLKPLIPFIVDNAFLNVPLKKIYFLIFIFILIYPLLVGIYLIASFLKIQDKNLFIFQFSLFLFSLSVFITFLFSIFDFEYIKQIIWHLILASIYLIIALYFNFELIIKYFYIKLPSNITITNQDYQDNQIIKNFVTDENVSNNYIPKIDLSNRNLKYLFSNYVYFSNVDFSGSNLMSSKFLNSYLKNVNFNNANLSNSTFENDKIKNCSFKNTNMNDSVIRNTTIKNSNFSDVNLSGSVFVNTKFVNCNLKFFKDKKNDEIEKQDENMIILNEDNRKIINNAKFIDVDFENNNISNIIFKNSVFIDVKGLNINLNKIDFDNCIFINSGTLIKKYKTGYMLPIDYNITNDNIIITKNNKIIGNKQLLKEYLCNTTKSRYILLVLLNKNININQIMEIVGKKCLYKNELFKALYGFMDNKRHKRLNNFGEIR